MTEKAILSAIILTLIYLALATTTIILIEKIIEKARSERNRNDEILVPLCWLWLIMATVIMVTYTNVWITIIVGIIILRFTNYKYKADKFFRYMFGITYGMGLIIGCFYSSIGDGNVTNVAEQYIETEVTNIVYGENVKVEELPQDTMCLEKIVLNDYSKNEDFYRYYYRIKEKDGKIELKSNGEIPKNNVEIHYVTDKEKAMFKKVVTETYYEKMFFEIEIPILKKHVETKYEFYIPRELLEVVEIK